MARNRDPFTQALSSLRDRILSGRLVGGAAVVVQDEAKRLSLSTTPIREALARLSGEGLVERAASGGYVAIRLDAAAARDRYAMHAHYVKLALDKTSRALQGGRPPAPAFDPTATGASVRALFEALVCSAGNQVLWEAFQKLSGQLDLLRRVEPLLFADLPEEGRHMFLTYGSREAIPFQEAVDRYHDRRIAGSGALAALILGGRLRSEEIGVASHAET